MSATLDSGRRNAPRNELRCATCGYGVIVRKAPATCPMCHGSVWENAARAGRRDKT